MTGYETLVEGHGVFCASASSTYPSYYPWEAFDRNTTDTSSEQAVWHTLADFTNATPGIYNAGASLGGYTGAWLKLKLPYSIKPSKVSIYPRTFNGAPPVADYAQNPKDFLILGSKDDNTWDILSAQADVVFGTTWKDFTLSPGNNNYSYFAISCTKVKQGQYFAISDMKYYGTPGPTTLDKGSLTLGRSLDVPRISRYDVDTETPRPEKLVVDFDTTINSSPTDISGEGNHGAFYNGASYSPMDKAFKFSGNQYIEGTSGLSGDPNCTVSWWMKLTSRTGTRVQVYIGGNPGTSRTGIGLFTSVASGSTALNGTIYFEGNDFQMGGVLELNHWNHITFTHVPGTLSNTTVKVYLNGVQLVVTHANTNAGSISLTDSNLRIGGGNVDGGFVVDSSQISNFKLYNVALEPSEVQELYRLGRTGRSMVISDTAVGIGKAPEAQLDVRGSVIVRGSLVLPTGTTTGSITGLAGMIRFNTDMGKLQVYDGSVWITIGGVSGTGGTISNAGGYTIHTFTGQSGTFQLFSGGTVEYLVVAGGGGGGTGGSTSHESGGGGAGGLLIGTLSSLQSGSYTVTVGGGGAVMSNGSNSSINFPTSITAVGGGQGDGSSGSGVGGNGGSGGGGRHNSDGGNATSGQGNDGGGGANFLGTSGTYSNSGGGGGGAGQAGGQGGVTDGGKGIQFTYYGHKGSPAGWFAGGGRGVAAGTASQHPSWTAYGGGGSPNAVVNSGTATAGVANTGGGGGGGWTSNSTIPGGAGGSGIVIIRYLT